ncbi:MAG: carbon-nitrogen hydrolase family protein [Candidatus Brachytrichaceae bacterium NZ_4S206]|jgi:predicted amidohydrolase
MPTTRIAALQFAVGEDIAHNLATCLRMIDAAATHKPDLMVLPEFCNHMAWYADQAHAWRVAVPLDSDFLAAIGERARRHRCFIKINCTVRRAGDRITGTNILFSPEGEPVAVGDKQVLMGNENNFLTPASTCTPVIETPIGKLGMYCCMDGVIPEVTRGLALRGAQILLNSLNSFALDEASLHIPVRAAENRCFVVAANKVGWLVPEALAPAIAQRIKLPPETLQGAGESQIVAPDGRVLAKGPRRGEAVVIADVDPCQADNKLRPDGTHIFAARRPALYAPIAAPPRPRTHTTPTPEVCVAVYQPADESLEAAARAVSEAIAFGAKLIVLPELFGLDGGIATDLAQAQAIGQRVTLAMRAALDKSDALIATSIVQGTRHLGVLIGQSGIVMTQPQLHACRRHDWCDPLGDVVHTFDAPFGRIAIVLGSDSIYPETFRLAALQDAEIVATPAHLLESWETELGLPERAAENRLNVIVASRRTDAGGSVILAASPDFTLWTEWKTHPFEGNINMPLITRAWGDGLTLATAYPAACANRMISQKTNLVEGRPWQLVEAIVSALSTS